MKKPLLSLFFLLACAQATFANRIDKLKTNKEVARFLVSVYPPFHGKYPPQIIVQPTDSIIKHCDPQAKNRGIKNWVKTDLNNDGRTDLLVIAYWGEYGNFAVIDKGDGTFQVITIDNSFVHQCELVNIINEGHTPLVLFHSKTTIPRLHSDDYDEVNRTDTLIYKFNTLVERNKYPASYHIDSVIFNSGSGAWGGASFEIRTGANGNATYSHSNYSRIQSAFHGRIQKDKLSALYKLINYIDIKKLKNSYTVNATDLSSCSVTVKFSDGSVKHIDDYGESGTFGLKGIYAMFSDLAFGHNWVANK